MTERVVRLTFEGDPVSGTDHHRCCCCGCKKMSLIQEFIHTIVPTVCVANQPAGGSIGLQHTALISERPTIMKQKCLKVWNSQFIGRVRRTSKHVCEFLSTILNWCSNHIHSVYYMNHRSDVCYLQITTSAPSTTEDALMCVKTCLWVSSVSALTTWLWSGTTSVRVSDSLVARTSYCGNIRMRVVSLVCKGMVGFKGNMLSSSVCYVI